MTNTTTRGAGATAPRASYAWPHAEPEPGLTRRAADATAWAGRRTSDTHTLLCSRRVVFVRLCPSDRQAHGARRTYVVDCGASWTPSDDYTYVRRLLRDELGDAAGWSAAVCVVPVLDRSAMLRAVAWYCDDDDLYHAPYPRNVTAPC